MSNKCQCTLAKSLTGDGCRFCQPQEYIDRLHEQIKEQDEFEEKIRAALVRCKEHIAADRGWDAQEVNANRQLRLEIEGILETEF